MFDEQMLNMVKEVSSKGYVNAAGKHIKGYPAVNHQLKLDTQITKSTSPKTADLIVDMCRNTSWGRKILIGISAAAIAGLAIRGLIAVVSDITKADKNEQPENEETDDLPENA